MKIRNDLIESIGHDTKAAEALLSMIREEAEGLFDIYKSDALVSVDTIDEEVRRRSTRNAIINKSKAEALESLAKKIEKIFRGRSEE